MAEVVTLSCLSCGSQLEIADEVTRFACGSCGQELLVRRGGGIAYLVTVIDNPTTGEDQAVSPSAEISRLTDEIQIIKDRMWTEKEGIPQESLYNFFVMLDNLGLERRGKKQTKSIFGFLFKPQSSEADIRHVLDTLTISDLDDMCARCVELTDKGVDMEHYRTAYQEIKWLEKDLLRIKGQIGL